jgi:hypothetical protein
MSKLSAGLIDGLETIVNRSLVLFAERHDRRLYADKQPVAALDHGTSRDHSFLAFASLTAGVEHGPDSHRYRDEAKHVSCGG